MDESLNASRLQGDPNTSITSSHRMDNSIQMEEVSLRTLTSQAQLTNIFMIVNVIGSTNVTHTLLLEAFRFELILIQYMYAYRYILIRSPISQTLY